MLGGLPYQPYQLPTLEDAALRGPTLPSSQAEEDVLLASPWVAVPQNQGVSMTDVGFCNMMKTVRSLCHKDLTLLISAIDTVQKERLLHPPPGYPAIGSTAPPNSLQEAFYSAASNLGPHVVKPVTTMVAPWLSSEMFNENAVVTANLQTILDQERQGQ